MSLAIAYQNSLKLPETVEEAVTHLLIVLDELILSEIKTIPENELTWLHITLGTTIRNALDLHNLESKLFHYCSVAHPDDASEKIILELWKQLKN